MARVSTSLRRRVAWAAALAAALGGAVAAAAAGLAARELVRRYEEAALRDAVMEMAGELHEALSEEAAGEPVRSMDARIAHELDDLKLPGASASLQLGGRPVAGDRTLPNVEPGTCREQDLAARRLRLCASNFDDGTLVLALPNTHEHQRAALITRALWMGLLSGALLGGLSSYLLAAWALFPLTTLRDRVRAVSADEPEPRALAEAASHVEIEELRSAIQNLVERLASSLDQARAFAAEAAHELRTPLTTIAGELELLAETLPAPRAGSSSAEQTAIARVRAQVASLIALVQRLLVLAQPNTSGAHALEVIDLADIVAAARSGLSPPLAARLDCHSEDDVLVRGDPTLLTSLCTNALENALKFSSGVVDVRVTGGEGEARLDVLDRGLGIAASDRERVFAPFFRTQETRARGYQGHGLGLSLIAKVAALHGGRAEFLTSDRGAHLRVSLPRYRGRGCSVSYDRESTGT